MSAASRPDVAWADTNLFVALFAGASHPLHEPVLDLFRRVTDGSLRLIVTPVVLAELVYVCESLFGWRRATTASRLQALLSAEGLEVREREVLAEALDLYGARGQLDFVDAYLAGSAVTRGPAVVASLDRDFDRLSKIRRVG